MRKTRSDNRLASDHDERRSSQTHLGGFTVLELVACISVIAVFLALLLPAVMACREASRAVQCRNHLHQLGVAVQMHHDTHLRLPSAWRVDDEQPNLATAWGQELLPFVEQEAAHGRSLAHWQSVLKSQPEDASLDVFLCPSDITQPSFGLATKIGGDDETSETFAVSASGSSGISNRMPRAMLMRLPTANYVGVFGTVEADELEPFDSPDGPTYGDGSVIHERQIRFRDLRRGLGQTLIVGERTMAMVPSTWLGIDLRGEDAACRVTGSAITHPNCEPCDECEFSSRHPGGSHFLYADSHVELVSESIDAALYRQRARRDPTFLNQINH